MSTTDSANASNLAGWLVDLYHAWSQQRSDLVAKWNRNWAAYKRSAKLDPKGKWKRSDRVEDWQSDTMSGATKTKVVAGWSIVTDMMFQGGRLAYMLVPEGVGSRPMVQQDAEARDQYIQQHEDAIHAQLKDCAAMRHMSAAVLCGAALGECYIKRVVREAPRVYYEQTDVNTFEALRWGQTQPAIEFRTPWCIVRDLEADDIQSGDGYFEDQPVSRHQVMKLVGLPYYLPREVIKHVLQNGGNAPAGTSGANVVDGDNTIPPERRTMNGRKRDRRLREFWGLAPRNLVEQFESYVAKVIADPQNARQYQPGEKQPDSPDDRDAEWDMVEIHAVLLDGTIIRFSRTERSDRPVERGVWEQELDSPGAVSVADNVEDEQHTLNGLIRSAEDNTKLAGNVILALKRMFIESDVDRIRPGMVIDISDDCMDARQALQTIQIQDITGPTRELIRMFLEFADESSQIPKISQGQVDLTPQTAFELKQRLAQAGKYLGGVIRNYDTLVENCVRWMYDFNMRDDTFTGPKGQYRVVALGFSSFEDRVTRMNRLVMLLQMVLQNDDLKAISKIRPIWQEIVKGNDVEPAQFVKSPDEIEADLEARRADLEQLNAQGQQGAQEDPSAGLARAKLIAEIGRLSAESALKTSQAKKIDTETLLKRAEAVAGSTVPPMPATPGADSAPAAPVPIEPSPSAVPASLEAIPAPIEAAPTASEAPVEPVAEPPPVV